jgi:Pvc16 N-terminal domain
MIDDLDNTIELLLRRELPASLLSQLAITFATPDQHFPPSTVVLPAIDFFLYDLRENRDLRMNEWTVARTADGSATRLAPPVWVECSYLVTAWSSPTVPDPARDEHRILGEVTRALLHYPVLPPEFLQGTLRNGGSSPPTTSLQPGKLNSLSEFWQAMGGKPRAAVNYTVTLAVSSVPAAAAGPAVVDSHAGING